uniref:DNA 3'-5' helicase n=1 Tax=Tetraodon nigroviridis TaxID=99883 RepID=H3CN59_TETNG
EAFEDLEDVEALPDAHFGLLGSSGSPVQPQGCVDDLPEEVLWQVLCLVPAQDLYRNVSLACHRWKNIVHDPEFVPYKKKYYRYMMGEKDTVVEIGNTLRTSGISSQPEHSIRKLVVLLAKHQTRARVRPEEILIHVRKHRLFPQTEASIRLRFRDVEDCFNPGSEQGPNPFAAMAVILILSESVADVQALVSLLGGCMSEVAITEFLSHVAMLLFAMMKTNIQISNRLHYNIYYVLHLMENGPFSVQSSSTAFSVCFCRQPQMHLTHEEQQILSHNIQQDHVVKIVAFAGTGKTSTLLRFAEQRPDLSFLYVAFNKSMAKEAERRFPRNVLCKTVHSLAFNDIGKKYCARKKLTSNLNPFALSSVLPEGRGGLSKSKVIAMTLSTFMASKDESISLGHVPSYRMDKNGVRKLIDVNEKQLFASDAQRIWKNMKNLNVRGKEGYYMTHDGYLKLWQLQSPKPRLSDKYDVILIDEAQDCTPAVIDVLLSQHCGKILVGDPHQQIYTFRGAVNALNTVEHTHIYYLTQSFRFGAEIAYVGATILHVGKNVRKILVGESVQTAVGVSQGKTAILSRSNLTVFSEAASLTTANPSCRIHFVGLKGINLNKIMDIWRLKQLKTEKKTPEGQRNNGISDRMIRLFARKNDDPFSALKRYIKKTDDKELDAKVCIVEKYGCRIPELVKCLERCSVCDYRTADFILGTVHKAKGLEFDNVVITDDFIKDPASHPSLHTCREPFMSRIPPDEWNLLYVAVTRARTTLIITNSVRRILNLAGEHFLISKTPSMNAGPPVPCMVPSCPNCISPGSAFVIKKDQKNKSNMEKKQGGPLCEKCVWKCVGPIAFL